MNFKKYSLPRKIYKRAYWLILDYPDLILKANDLVQQSSEQDGQPRGTGTSDPVFRAVLKREVLTRDISAIENGLKHLPRTYQQPIFANMVYGKPYPEIASSNTWKFYRKMFVYYVAVEAGYL